MIQERDYMRAANSQPGNFEVAVDDARNGTLADCRPGDWVEVEDLPGIQLIVWSRHGLMLVSTYDAFATKIDNPRRRCRKVRAILSVTD